MKGQMAVRTTSGLLLVAFLMMQNKSLSKLVIHHPGAIRKNHVIQGFVSAYGFYPQPFN